MIYPCDSVGQWFLGHKLKSSWSEVKKSGQFEKKNGGTYKSE